MVEFVDVEGKPHEYVEADYKNNYLKAIPKSDPNKQKLREGLHLGEELLQENCQFTLLSA